MTVQRLLLSTFREDQAIRFIPHAWPSRSPDMTPFVFSLWGHLTSKVYCNKSPSLLPWKYTIHQHVASILQEILLNVVNSVAAGLKAMLLNDEQPIEQLQA